MADFIKERFTEPSDISEHLGYMRRLAFNCASVVEFGVRAGFSTAAWLDSAISRLTSYDWAEPLRLAEMEDAARASGVEFTFHQADTSKLEDIPPCDLLFIDTLHTKKQVEAELKHAHRAARYIVLHDTVAFGEQGEGGEEGIIPAIDEFLIAHPEWTVIEHFENCNGLMVLERRS